MKAEKLKVKLLSGNLTSWSFADACHLARHCGWKNSRISGIHHIFTHPRNEIGTLNIQNKKGEAKPYQMRQMLEQIQSHHL